MAKYITTTLPYVNADPHIGLAVELVQADTLARTWREKGENVFFSTGTDEHGQKIFEAATKAGRSVEDYVAHYAKEVQNLREVLGLSTDAFIRTTNPEHIAAAQEMWKRCEKAGDVYKKSYTGLYCVGCEEYKNEREIENGICPLHPSLTPTEVTEENYFFALSKYQDRLLEYVSRPGAIFPEWRQEEAKKFIQSGLEDFSISRSKERLSWGVPVPGDDAQVMYVWFDALTNYISTLGWPKDTEQFEGFWMNGTTVQVAGKDQVRFQSLMWQAMLMSADIKNTDTVFYHGFINSGGQRMSKSLGNVISPYELVQKYGAEATRYLLLRHVHPFEDTDVTWERMDEWYTANMVNGLGNLVARVMKLAEEHLSEPVAYVGDSNPAFIESVEAYKFNEALDMVFALVSEGDEYMTQQEPYKKIKVEDTAEEARKDIAHLVTLLGRVATLLTSVMPETSEHILAAVSANKKPENLFPRLG
ncbi:methionine--tRNA ligase [Patescibacteria group bacterium]|nr:methionine--tRNA ligase [Patescibacteria group bacterium]MBU1755129.1 methionine--tRNA ligase [Patescibacteria group bacterium]